MEATNASDESYLYWVFDHLDPDDAILVDSKKSPSLASADFICSPADPTESDVLFYFKNLHMLPDGTLILVTSDWITMEGTLEKKPVFERLELDQAIRWSREENVKITPAFVSLIDPQHRPPTPDEGKESDPLRQLSNRREYSVPSECERDKWIYEHFGPMTFDDLSVELGFFAEKKKWKAITSRNGIKSAARRYADHHSLPWPPTIANETVTDSD